MVTLATTWSKNPAGKTVSEGAATTGLADGGDGSPLEDGFWPVALHLRTGGPSEPTKASKARVEGRFWRTDLLGGI